MNLSMVPPCRKTMSVIAPRYSFSVATTVSAGRRSESEVKPRMSLNRMVMGTRCPPSFSASPASASRPTTCGSTKRLNMSRTLRRSRPSVT